MCDMFSRRGGKEIPLILLMTVIGRKRLYLDNFYFLSLSSILHMKWFFVSGKISGITHLIWMEQDNLDLWALWGQYFFFFFVTNNRTISTYLINDIKYTRKWVFHFKETFLLNAISHDIRERDVRKIRRVVLEFH